MTKASSRNGVRARPSLTLSFFAVGFSALVLLMGWAGIDPEMLLGGYYQPRLLAFVHAFVLGWLGSVFIGAAYQLGPVIAENSLRWSWLGWLHLVLHVAGVPMMIHGFAAGDFHWVMVGGSLVTCGFVAFILTQVATASIRWRADAVGCGLVIAWFWLAVTLGIGLYMTENRLADIGPSPSPWLQVHALLGVLGFFLTVFNAVSLRLIPMFAVTAEQSPGRIWASLILTQAGLQFIPPAILLPYGFLKAAATGLVVTGQVLFIWEIAAQLFRRHRRLDTALRGFSAAFLWLPPALAGFYFILVQPLEGLTFLDDGNGAVLIFAVFLVGCLTSAILAMSFKIIPFLIWQAAYAKYLGRQRTPMLDSLVSQPLLIVALVAVNSGTIVLLAALALQSPMAVRAGVLLLAGAGMAVIINSLLAGRHLHRPRLEPLQPFNK